MNFPHKGQLGGDVMFSLICVWINGWVNNRQAGDFKRDRAHYDVIEMDNALDRRRSFHPHSNKTYVYGKTQGLLNLSDL